MKIPGGPTWSENTKDTKLTSLSQGLDLSPDVKILCKDNDFAESFIDAVPDEEEQKKYLINSSKYASRNQYDPNYVLFFRRTLPSGNPKPEERWTNEFIQARNGLRREIPEGPHRLHTIILCDTLSHILINGEKEGNTNPFTDGELAVNFQAYDQSRSLCKFKPAQEKEKLDEYLKKDGAMTAQQITDIIRENKNRIDSTLN
jgi:hypothetical protein